MTPYRAFLFASAIYAPVQTVWFKQVLTIGDVTVGVAVDEDGHTVIALPGTQRLVDVLDDIQALPFDAGSLGMVHTGAFKDMPAVLEAIRPHLIGPVSITGHSLGAMRAAQLAGLCAVNGVLVAQLFMFEPARPGYAALADVVRAHVPEIIGTRNARDEVPDWPLPFPFPYCHIVDLIDLQNPGPGFEPIEDHLLVQVGPGVLKRWPELQAAPAPIALPSSTLSVFDSRLAGGAVPAAVNAA